MRVLITGGSGYLGQFLIVALSSAGLEVAYTYCNTALESCTVQAFKVNIAKGEGLSEAVLGFQPEVVINCAAVSQPAVCEQSYETCRALNRPSRLVEALQQLQEQYHVTALLIHLSTDQVRLCRCNRHLVQQPDHLMWARALCNPVISSNSDVHKW
jgi:dTDP-4-dehydrorhamnose reductase